MKQLEWNYIAVIYDNDTYGKGGFEDLKSLATVHGICIAASFPVTIGELGEISFNEIRTVVRRLITHGESSISGLVVFGASRTSHAVLLALQAEENTFNFNMNIIFSEAIGLDASVFKSGPKDIAQAKGSFNVIPSNIIVSEFVSHWENILTNHTYMLEEAQTNPWLFDVIESVKGCRPSNQSQLNSCPFLSSSEATDLMETSIHEYYVILGAIVQAAVLKQIHNKTCTSSGMCDGLKNILYNNKGKLIEETRNIDINSDNKLLNTFPKFNISFANGAVDFKQNEHTPFYEIYHYRNCDPSQKELCFVKVRMTLVRREKGRDLTQTYDKSPYTNRNVKGAK